MSNTEASTDVKTTQTEQSKTEPVQVVEKKTSGAVFSTIALLFSLLALAATGFTWYQIQVAKVQDSSSLVVGMNDIGAQITRLGDSVSRLQTEQANVITNEQLTTRLLQVDSDFDKQVRNLNDTQEDLSASLEKITSDLQKGSQEFVLDEVSQLLKLGNNSAIFAGDADAAVKAFSLADIQLKEIANPRYAVVRRKINDEIELLKSVELVDKESVLAKLNALSKTIPSLPLENEPPVVEQAQVVQETSDSQESLTWRTELAKLWSDLLGTVTIQRVEQPPKPLLAPSERYFLDQNLQLNLNKAEIALLQGRQALYRQSLDDARTWLNEYFDLQNDDVTDVIGQLDELSKMAIDVDLPAVSDSYDLLQSLKGGQ